jgi:hypothetical protein
MIDFTMMYAAHEAFRRDLRLLAERPDEARWEMFRRQLLIHHQAEDEIVWPLVRQRIGDDPGALALLDEMEAEHARIDPLLDSGDVRALSALLDVHLEHEEREALPLIDSVLSPQEWAAFAAAMRERQGGALENAKQFLTWLLDGIPDELRERVFAVLPPQARQILAG